MDNLEAAIRKTLDTLYGEVFTNGKADLLADLVAGPYVQHNPAFPDGIEPLVGFLQQFGGLPNEVKRRAIDGDLAFVHVLYPKWHGKPHAAVDIFRFDAEGRIVEHWDVFQAVPETTASGHSMF